MPHSVMLFDAAVVVVFAAFSSIVQFVTVTESVPMIFTMASFSAPAVSAADAVSVLPLQFSVTGLGNL